MPVVGFQDFWVAGSRFYFKRDPSGSTNFPLLDLGVVEPINPAIEVEKITKEDPECGSLRTVDERVARIAEKHTIVCKNFNIDNLALLFQSNEPQNYIQQASDAVPGSGYAVPGRLMKAKLPNGELAWGLIDFYGVFTNAQGWPILALPLDQIAPPANLYLSGNHEDKGLHVGQEIVVSARGLANPSVHAKKYTLTTAASYDIFSDRTTFQVSPDPYPPGDGPGINGYVIHGHDVTWNVADVEVVDLARGLLRVKPSASILGEADILFAVYALSGKRLINPMSLSGEAVGVALVYWCRGNGQEETLRRAKVSLTPSNINIQDADYSSFTLEASVLSSDVGDLVYFKGNEPSQS